MAGPQTQREPKELEYARMDEIARGMKSSSLARSETNNYGSSSSGCRVFTGQYLSGIRRVLIKLIESTRQTGASRHRSITFTIVRVFNGKGRGFSMHLLHSDSIVARSAVLTRTLLAFKRFQGQLLLTRADISVSITHFSGTCPYIYFLFRRRCRSRHKVGLLKSTSP